MKMNKLALIISSALLAFSAKAASPDLVKGIDLTGLSSFTAAQLNQLVDNATPAANRGMVIVQTTTPDTTTYPRFTNYLWLDISAVPYSIKAYTTGSWSVATIGANSIGNANLINGAVTSNKIASATIVGTNLAANIITYDKIADGNVIAGKYAVGSITNADIAVNAVQTGNILDQNVTTAKIKDAAITSIKLAAGAIVTTNLAAGSIYGTNIAGNTITQTNIADQGVGLTNIVRGTATYAMRMNAAGTALEYVSGGYLGHAYTNIFEYLTNTTVVPYDNSRPTSTEGDEIATLTLTAKYSDSYLHFQGVVNIGGTAGTAALCIFKDSSTDADYVIPSYNAGAGSVNQLVVNFYLPAVDTSAHTWHYRLGPQSGTLYVNRDGSTLLYGNKPMSSLSISEVR